jgi:hypothetical protein
VGIDQVGINGSIAEFVGKRVVEKGAMRKSQREKE